MKKSKPPAPDVDAGALLARLRVAFQAALQSGAAGDWSYADETLREVYVEILRIVDSGDMDALYGALHAHGYLIAMFDARQGARATGKRTGGQHARKVEDPDQLLADYEAALATGERGARQKIADKYGIALNSVTRLRRKSKKRET